MPSEQPAPDEPVEYPGDAPDVQPVQGAPTVPATRASRAWVRIVPALLLLAVILVFVFQNLRRTRVTFVTATGTFPLAVALLVAAALGALLVLALGSVRILQLRKVIRRADVHRAHRADEITGPSSDEVAPSVQTAYPNTPPPDAPAGGYTGPPDAPAGGYAGPPDG